MFEPMSSAVAAGQRSDRRAVLVERGEDDRRPRGHIRGRPDVLEETLQRVRRSYPDLEDVALHPGDRVALLDGGQIGERGGRASGWATSIGVMETNAVSGSPSCFGSRLA